MILLTVYGVVLYLGSYFWGAFLMIGALLVFGIEKQMTSGRSVLIESLKGSVKSLSIPFFGFFSALIVGMIIMIITGYDPIESYVALFYGGLVKNWSVSVLNATPLIFTGLSIAFAFQAGLFNIGAEGQYYVGAMVATFLGLYLHLPPLFTILLVIIIAGSLAAAWNFVPALLKVRTGAHEVITTMMLAHTARYLSPIFIRAFGGDPNTSSHAYVTDPILESSWLPRFKGFLPDTNYRMHIGIIIAIAFALIVYYILYKTRIGFEIRAVGQNPNAARAQGISIGRNIFIALLFSGFLAGMSGVVQVLGLDHKLFLNLAGGYGWNGISVALLASNNPIGVIFTALLWGVLDAGGQYMVRVTDTPNSIVEIIKGIILFLIVARYIYAYWGNRIKRKRRKSAEAEADRVRLEGGKA
jgi:simple sugar transport system permease protein